MIYVIKLPADDDYNVLIEPIAIPYGMDGYVPWDAIKYDDNVVDVTDKVSEEVKSAWIGGSMWGWDKKPAAAAVEYVKGRKAMDNMIKKLPI